MAPMIKLFHMSRVFLTLETLLQYAHAQLALAKTYPQFHIYRFLIFLERTEQYFKFKYNPLYNMLLQNNKGFFFMSMVKTYENQIK